jgi:hypothetical protein
MVTPHGLFGTRLVEKKLIGAHANAKARNPKAH